MLDGRLPSLRRRPFQLHAQRHLVIQQLGASVFRHHNDGSPIRMHPDVVLMGNTSLLAVRKQHREGNKRTRMHQFQQPFRIHVRTFAENLNLSTPRPPLPRLPVHPEVVGPTVAFVRPARCVAQIFNLPFRRVALGKRSADASGVRIENPRYSRVQLCATSPGRYPHRQLRDTRLTCPSPSPSAPSPRPSSTRRSCACSRRCRCIQARPRRPSRSAADVPCRRGCCRR